ncbi:hypothetical protein, partial [Bifidobacterium longum]|uniref:hypothetical protein n=1 Tax=Bifidobacterium longum TaxID=216816 RepID=UPI003218F69E
TEQAVSDGLYHQRFGTPHWPYAVPKRASALHEAGQTGYEWLAEHTQYIYRQLGHYHFRC